MFYRYNINVLLIFFISNAAFAASFDCNRAVSPVEKAICGDADLSRLDEQVAARYQELRKSLPQDKAEQLHQAQIVWIKKRKECGVNTGCLFGRYAERLDFLNVPPVIETEGGFNHLANYNAPEYYPWVDRFWKDKQIQDALRQLIGSDYKTYKDSSQAIEIGVPLVGTDGVLRIYGGVPHVYTIAETALMIEPSGNVYVALLEDGKRVLYYTNNKSMVNKLPPEFVAWSSRFRDVPVFYKNQ